MDCDGVDQDDRRMDQQAITTPVSGTVKYDVARYSSVTSGIGKLRHDYQEYLLPVALRYPLLCACLYFDNVHSYGISFLSDVVDAQTAKHKTRRRNATRRMVRKMRSIWWRN